MERFDIHSNLECDCHRHFRSVVLRQCDGCDKCCQNRRKFHCVLQLSSLKTRRVGCGLNMYQDPMIDKRILILLIDSDVDPSRAVEEHKFHDYRYSLLQMLAEQLYDKRKAFCIRGCHSHLAVWFVLYFHLYELKGSVGLRLSTGRARVWARNLRTGPLTTGPRGQTRSGPVQPPIFY